MVELSISGSDAALALLALGYFDEEVLPYSVTRQTLYELMKYIRTTFGFQEHERGMHRLLRRDPRKRRKR